MPSHPGAPRIPGKRSPRVVTVPECQNQCRNRNWLHATLQFQKVSAPEPSIPTLDSQDPFRAQPLPAVPGGPSAEPLAKCDAPLVMLRRWHLVVPSC